MAASAGGGGRTAWAGPAGTGRTRRTDPQPATKPVRRVQRAGPSMVRPWTCDGRGRRIRGVPARVATRDEAEAPSSRTARRGAGAPAQPPVETVGRKRSGPPTHRPRWSCWSSPLAGLVAALVAGGRGRGGNDAALVRRAPSGAWPSACWPARLCARLRRTAPRVAPSARSSTPPDRAAPRARRRSWPPARAVARGPGRAADRATSRRWSRRSGTATSRWPIGSSPPWPRPGRRRAGERQGGDWGGGADGGGARQRRPLARRMRRMAKTLQVLADDPDSREAAAAGDHGGGHGRRRGRQRRVRPHRLPLAAPGAVEGEVVPDVVHLLAELIDNAVQRRRQRHVGDGAGTPLRRRLHPVGRRRGLGHADDQRNVANDRCSTRRRSPSSRRRRSACPPSAGWPPATTSRCTCSRRPPTA